MNKKIALSSRIEALEKIRIKHSGNDTSTQTKRLLEAIETLGGVSTIEANRYLDILHPPARKLDLIEAGHSVDLLWVYEPSGCGKIHRVGKYVFAGRRTYPLFDGLDDERPA